MVGTYTYAQVLKVGTFVLLGFYFASISLHPQSAWHLLDSVNLIFHEAGHVVFFFLGDFVQALGGTLMQVLVPASVVYYFYQHRQYFSAYVVLFWVGHNLVNIAVYAGDAIVMQLPLLGGGSHDWHYLLSSLGLLQATPYIAGMFYVSGFMLYALAVYLGVYEALGKKLSTRGVTSYR